MTNIINPALVFLDVAVTSKTKEEALILLGKKISEVTLLSATELTTGFTQREALSTTGFGSGFAIPHTKIKKGEGLVAFFKFSEPVEWASMDDQPVTTAIALVMPETDESNQHLKMISKLARLLMHDDFIETLAALSDETQISDYLTTKLED